MSQRAALAQPGKDAESIDRVGRIRYRDFLQNYVIPRRPVILEGAIDHWPARNWTAASLSQKLYNSKITYRSEKGPMEGLCGPLIERVMSGNEPGLYLRNIDLIKELPELIPDVTPNIPLALADWRSTALIPHRWLAPAGLFELFIGGKGTKFPVLHVDYWGLDAFLSQIQGVKEVILFGPDQSPYLYRNSRNPLLSDVNDVFQPDLKRFPLFEHARMTRILLQPGETIYNPNGWWHGTQTNQFSITVIQTVWNRGNWPILIAELWRTRSNRPLIQTLLITQYLKMLRPWLLLREKFHEHLFE